MTLRKVMVTAWVGGGNSGQPAQLKEKGMAIFHTWGSEIEEGETNLQYSVAIIEWSSGQVETVPPCRIKFIT